MSSLVVANKSGSNDIIVLSGQAGTATVLLCRAVLA